VKVGTRLVGLLAALSLAIAGIGVLRSKNGPWVRVARDDLILEVDVTGTLQAEESALLGPPQLRGVYEFTITMMAPEGDLVPAGTPVLAFDSSILTQQLDRMTVELEEARKKVAKQLIDLEIRAADHRLRIAEAEARLRKARLEAQQPPELIASIEFEKAALDLELAESLLSATRREIAALRAAGEARLDELRSDEARVASRIAELERALARMTVNAPREGIVIHTSDWRGQKRQPGETCWYDDAVIEIPDLERMTGAGEVREAEAGRVRSGQPVVLHLDAHPEIEYAGTVGEISRVVQRRSWRNPLKIVRLDVILERTDPGRMRPGMRFRGSIEVARHRDVLLVPLQAVQVRVDGPVVFRETLTGRRATPVGLGRRNRQVAEVLTGLREGERVLMAPPAPPRESP
jgi:hypothetical protein